MPDAINKMGICGQHSLGRMPSAGKENLYLVRQPDNPYDRNAVLLHRADGKDIGYLPEAIAAEIAPRLDKGSPVTATFAARFKKGQKA